MPVHDWTRVDAGIFHSCHLAWITHLKESLNGGLLPEGFYALSEQPQWAQIDDILTLLAPGPTPEDPERFGAVAVAEAPPQVGRRLTSASENSTYRALRQTLAIHRTDGHRIVALIETSRGRTRTGPPASPISSRRSSRPFALASMSCSSTSSRPAGTSPRASTAPSRASSTRMAIHHRMIGL